jgi:hypothetical protein
VHVLGRPLKSSKRNAERAVLLAAIVQEILARLDWHPLDAVLLPAAYFRFDADLGACTSGQRGKRIERSEFADACRIAAGKLQEACGAVLVIGADTLPRAGFSGDQFMAAWGPDGVVGSARKVFPSRGDSWPAQGKPYRLFEHDADDPARFIRLGHGGKALLCLCYDAFAFSELARGPTSSRAAMRFLGTRDGGRDLSSDERDELLGRFAALIEREKPDVALITVHGFDQPGRETRWQRHGIASTSAGLGGALAVGAAHFRYALPDAETLDHAPLASLGVPTRHLTQGLHRTARKLAAEDGFLVKVKGAPHLRAVVRVFQG